MDTIILLEKTPDQSIFIHCYLLMKYKIETSIDKYFNFIANSTTFFRGNKEFFSSLINVN